MKHIALRSLGAVLVLLSLLLTACSGRDSPASSGTTAATTAATTTAATTDPPPVHNPADDDGKFSIAILPDTQQEVVIDYAIRKGYFAQRNEWVVARKDEIDLRFVLHTGDVVNWGNEDENQLVIASEAMAVYDRAEIPVIYALGNHDTAAVGVGGSAAVPAETRTRVRDTTAFNKYFTTSRYPYLNVMEEGRVENAYALFEAGGVKWMVLTLELWPRTEVVDWARKVVRTHPEYNVIVITHSYLTNKGEISTSNGGYGANSPEYLYDRLIRYYDNICMVFCGHTGQSTVRTDVGRKGNKIVSVLGCYHSNEYNPVRLLEVDVKNGTLTSRVYVPLNGEEWTQYAFTIDGMHFIGAE